MKHVALTLLLLGAQDVDRLGPEAEAVAKTRLAKINAEAAKLKDHPWAGHYFMGDGLGLNIDLTLAPDSGFVYEWRGCLGLYDRNWGKVTRTDKGLELAFELPNAKSGIRLPSTLVPVRWGKRVYLVSADDIVDFCNEVNAGDEPRAEPHGSVLLRVEKELPPAEGRPEVPAEFRPWLLDRPIRAALAAPQEWKDEGKGRWGLRVTLGAGTADGVRKGMAFHWSYHVARVTTVAEKSCEAELSTYSESERPQAPAAGTEFSTRP